MATVANFSPSGVMAALVTPLHEDGRLDEAGLDRLVERVLVGGADGLSPVGSTGEGALLTREQRLAVTARVRKLAPAGTPVVPGVPVVTLADGQAELAALADLGATAALAAPPAYYPLSDDGVRRLFETLASGAPLPILLYNIPVFTKVRISPPVVAQLAGHPAIAGIKDSGRDLEYQQAVISATAGAEFSVLTGADSMLVASLAMGAAGTIAASVNLVPELTAGIYRACAAGDVAAARPLQARLARIIAACRQGFFPAGWKAALAEIGVCAAHPAPPGTALSAGELARLRELLAAEDVTG
jgi:dihydrodipicolinate synthase/N-acetylneuraminate lyase